MKIFNTMTVLVLLQLSLAGCSTQQVMDGLVSSPLSDREDASAERVDTVDAAVPLEEAVANPYLSDRQSVPSQAQQRFDQALTALHNQDWVWAQAELEYLTVEYPELSGPHLNLALLYQQQGDHELAEVAFVAAIRSNALNVNAYNEYGIFLRHQGRFQEAEAIYLEALGVWEQNPDVHRNIGVLYDLYMGDRERALQHFYRYQNLTGADDRAVAGWIADLERQMMMLAKGG